MKLFSKPGIPCPNCGSNVKHIVGIHINTEGCKKPSAQDSEIKSLDIDFETVGDDSVSIVYKCDNCEQRMKFKSVKQARCGWVFFDE